MQFSYDRTSAPRSQFTFTRPCLVAQPHSVMMHHQKELIKEPRAKLHAFIFTIHFMGHTRLLIWMHPHPLFNVKFTIYLSFNCFIISFLIFHNTPLLLSLNDHAGCFCSHNEKKTLIITFTDNFLAFLWSFTQLFYGASLIFSL